MIDVADRGEKARVLSEETIAPDLYNRLSMEEEEEVLWFTHFPQPRPRPPPELCAAATTTTLETAETAGLRLEFD